MKWIRILGPLAIVVAAALAIIDPGAASTQDETEDPEIVLCKHAALALCESPTWGAGKTITSEFEPFKILGTLNFQCNKASFVGKILNAMALSLEWKVESATIGECENGCTVAVEEPGVADFTVDTGDRYLLLLPLKLKAVCGKLTCVYKGHSSIELLETNTTGTPKTAAVSEPFTTVTGTGCGTTAKWDTPEILLKSTLGLPILFSLYDLA